MCPTYCSNSSLCFLYGLMKVGPLFLMTQISSKWSLHKEPVSPTSGFLLHAPHARVGPSPSIHATSWNYFDAVHREMKTQTCWRFHSWCWSVNEVRNIHKRKPITSQMQYVQAWMYFVCIPNVLNNKTKVHVQYPKYADSLSGPSIERNRRSWRGRHHFGSSFTPWPCLREQGTCKERENKEKRK